MIYPRSADDDTDAYLELGRNLFQHGTYGMADQGEVSPSLFRLPGYPIFLNLLGGHIWLVFVVQSALDLAGGYLLALFLRRYWSERAGLTALALSSLCLFTAYYADTALTESLSIFAVAAAIYCLGEFLGKPPGAPTSAVSSLRVGSRLPKLLALAACASLAMLLRPDGALLTISIAVALLAYGIRRANPIAALRASGLFVLLACLPLVPWTIRNAVTFHVFQPLAPRHVNDPGEPVNLGFYRWLRTWSVDYETTQAVFWKVGTEPIDMRELPPRAIDSEAERARTAELIAAYNRTHQIDQPLDDRFAALAAARIQHDPLRYFVWVPVLRVADIWLRPRTEGLDIDSSWWRWHDHPAQSAAAIALGLLNLFYVGAAIFGAFRKPPLAVLLATYFILRCLLLATMENPEPRYTLEAYPIVIVLAAIFLGRLNTDLHRKKDQDRLNTE
jgi:4-amino-4-deoxy-L-arabinose transferase-like glycosyltransferase